MRLFLTLYGHFDGCCGLFFFLVSVAHSHTYQMRLIQRPPFFIQACILCRSRVKVIKLSRLSYSRARARQIVLVRGWQKLRSWWVKTVQNEKQKGNGYCKNRNCAFLHQCLLLWKWRNISLKSHIEIVFTIFSWFVEIVHILLGLSYGFKDFRKLLFDIVSEA